MNLNKLKQFVKNFYNPILVFIGIIVYLLLILFSDLKTLSIIVALASIILGSVDLVKETIDGLRRKQYALDYIAILAILVSIYTQEYLVGLIIALMLSTGRTLETYGVNQAKKSLKNLSDRIPREVLLIESAEKTRKVDIKIVKVGDEVLVRKGEVVPLDGTLISERGYTDESSLTGEPYFLDKYKGDIIRSGTINSGDSFSIKVTAVEKDSTYNKIINLVQSAQSQKAPLVRLADKYSTYFTLITLLISAFAYWYGGSIESVLAVLVIATPCPLILATPIALMGGVNKAAKNRIIVKNFAAIETLNRVNVVVFDKTGTITLGIPKLSEIKILDKNFSEEKILAISSAIERSSLHPIAKAVVDKAQDMKVHHLSATDIKEEIGKGISGTVDCVRYNLSKSSGEDSGLTISLYKDNKEIAKLNFKDEIKEDSTTIIKNLSEKKYKLFVFTGDKLDSAKIALKNVLNYIDLKAHMSPNDKYSGVQRLKTEGNTIAMIGDGINDAPALALADVGMVFSNQEQTAASEAADVIMIGGNFALVAKSLEISNTTIKIAMQSILWGIGLSIVGMIIASFGYIPPILGAGIQEIIDVAVILNALRASR